MRLVILLANAGTPPKTNAVMNKHLIVFSLCHLMLLP